ncbi:MAG: transcription termination factor NusA [Bdellovibrionales bacterium]
MSEESNLKQVIDLVSKEKGVDREIVTRAIVLGILGAIRKKYGTYRDIEAKYNSEAGEIELFEFKKVVTDSELEDDLIEMKYSEATELDSEVQIGEQIGTSLDLQDFGRIHVQAAMQTMFQNLKKAEHDIIFNEFEKRKGEITSGVVRRVDPGMIVVDLGKTEAYIPRREQIPGEIYKSGDRIQGYLSEVRQTTKGPRIIMSRAHENYLIKLFESEVPEVYEGIVKIVAAAREPGQRAKMAVYSTDLAVHPVGACVGIRGSRVQNITQELKGERIDVIIWEEDPVQYICNALAPAKISKVLLDEENKQMQIIVPEDQLSLAIGKKGQNVRLAVKLTGWNLNLMSEQQRKEALFNLALLPDLSDIDIQNIFQNGFSSVQQISEVYYLDFQGIPGFETSEKAKNLIKSAKKLVEQYTKEGKSFPQLEGTEKKAEVNTNLKEKAEEILKRELAQLDGASETTEAVAKKPEEETASVEAAPEATEKPEEETASVEAAPEKPEEEAAVEATPETITEKTEEETATPETSPEKEEDKPEEEGN